MLIENVNRGVGSHSVFSGKYMKNINISNNTFNNVSGYAVLASSFLNVTINNNSITTAAQEFIIRALIPNLTANHKGPIHTNAQANNIRLPLTNHLKFQETQ